MSQAIHLGDLQCAIMRVLWSRGEATVAEVHAVLHADRGLALTTIATMLSKMEKKGVVSHRTRGRRFVYRSEVAERDVHRSMVSELVDRLFAGDAGALVSHLLTERQIDPAELARLEALVAAKERETRGRDGD